MAGHNRVGRKATAAVVSMLVALAFGVGAPVAGAQDCAGTVSTSVTSEAIPGGEWSVTDGCLPAETFFEYSDGVVHAKAAVSSVTYDDGHQGRVAAGVLTLGEGAGLSIVGVEDQATGVIKWSAVLGDYTESGDSVTVSGPGVTLFPSTPAELSVSITGTGTDIAGLLDPGEVTDNPVDESTTTMAVPDGAGEPTPEATEPSVTTSTVAGSPSTSTVPPTTAPEPVDPTVPGAEPGSGPEMPPAGPVTTTTLKP